MLLVSFPDFLGEEAMLVQSRLSTECILVPSFSQYVLYMLTRSLRMWLRMSQLGIPRGEGLGRSTREVMERVHHINQKFDWFLRQHQIAHA